ncbi:MAG TPA: hypothetical protein VFY75_03020 [Solirubrobacterales bacterium]|nr:hypothetical protein [Solirubrobacterales bacterium]
MSIDEPQIEKFDCLSSRGRVAASRNPDPKESAMSIVTILIIVILVLLAIYLFQRVF